MLGLIFIAGQMETLQLNKGQKPVLGRIFIAGQVETLQLNK